MKTITTTAGLVMALLAGMATMAQAEECARPNWKGDTLTGDWGDLRNTLYDRGLDIGLSHKSDVFSNLSGGLKRGTEWVGHAEVRVAIDFDKLLGWPGTTAYIHYHDDLGSKFNRDYIGAFGGVDNIEVAKNTAQFYHAWVQKSFLDDRLSVLAGIYPIDAEFYVTDTSALFISPPYGMSNEMAQTGRNGPPVFPLGALALRVKYTTPGRNFYLMGALTDGVPGDPNNPHGTHVKLGNKDGTLQVVEFGYTPQTEAAEADENKPGQEEEAEEPEIFNKTAIGFWRYTAHFDDIEFGAARRRQSQGAYVLAERTLFVEPDHPAQGLSGFIRFGVANEDTHVADWTGSLGLRYHGLVPGRDDDIAGIAVTVNHAGSKWRRFSDAESHETDIEATYRAQLANWFALQPMTQYIVNPGMDRALKNAWLVGMRAELTF